MTSRAMKDSGVEWIGKIPNEWQVLKFKYVMKKDKVIAKKYNNEDVISLTKSGVIIRDLENPTGKMPASFDGYQHVEEGDLLLCLFDIDVTPRCVGIVRNSGVTSPAYSRYRLLDGFDINYYNYLLTYLDDEKILLSYTKSLRNTLTDEYFGAVSTIKPSIKEQQKIAAFLDVKVAHIDNILEDTKQSIENLKAYKQSLITETVTKGLDLDVEMKDSGIEWIGKIPKRWNVGKLKYLTEIKRGASPRPIIEFLTSKEEGFNWIKIGDTTSGEKFINHTSQNINKQGAVKSVEILPGDLVMSNSMSIGRPYISKIKGYIHDGWLAFHFDENTINSEWLYYLLTASVDSLKRLSQGTTVNNLNIERVQSLIIPFYDIKEQLEIASYLNYKIDSIDTLIIEKDKLINELESYKQLIIYEYVTGKKEIK